MTSASTTEVTYDVNERVLCYHGPLIYEAKVLKPPVQYDDATAPSGTPGPHYFVHYKGWKQTYVQSTFMPPTPTTHTQLPLLAFRNFSFRRGVILNCGATPSRADGTNGCQ